MKETPCANKPGYVNIEISYEEHFDIRVELARVPDSRLREIPRRNMDKTNRALDSLTQDDVRQACYGTVSTDTALYIKRLLRLGDVSKKQSALRNQAITENVNGWNKLFD